MDLRGALRQVTGARAMAARLPVVMTRRGREQMLRAATGDHPPGTYYSPIPSTRDIGRAGTQVVDLPGIDLRLREQWGLLEELATLIEPPTTEDDPHRRYDFDNLHYGWTDGATLQGVIRKLEPKNIVEIRSGTSTGCVLDTISMYGIDTALTFVDPNPTLDAMLRPDERDRVTVIDRDLHDAGTEVYERLGADDILFIHSPHVVKVGSDLLWLVFEVLPRLAPGVWVSFHDILPGFEYPTHWFERGWYWSESYLLRAFLEFNDDYRINLWPSLLERLDPDRARRLLWTVEHDPGSAFWIQRT